MKKIKSVIIVFIMLVVLILTVIVIRKMCTQNYIYQDILLDIKYIFQYEEVIQKRGTPVKTIQKQLDYNMEATVLLVYYEDMVIVYNFDEEEQKVGEFVWAQIESDQYKFGKKEVCIGMTKKEIEKIFKYSRQPSPAVHRGIVYDSEGNGKITSFIRYFDNYYDLGLGFIYDENDVVEYIDIYFGL